MGKRKIINDPLYGFINFDFDLIYDLVDHRYFQRLRRINQMGLSSLVYPGAVHSRFHHALGAAHLMKKAVGVLRSKGVSISKIEAEAVTIAILLHDIGHGPFSHALEYQILNVHHEALTLRIMESLNNEFEGQLDLAIQIFKGAYHRPFFHQLVSSQLDTDRMDYINRDSFFTGVAEGRVGYERIINMLNVVEDQLVVEEKAIYSVEKFILSRRMMYWQVYLHKTSIVAENMLRHFVKNLKQTYLDHQLDFELNNRYMTSCFNAQDDKSPNSKLIEQYLHLDDTDIWILLKKSTLSANRLLSELSKGLVERKLWKIVLQEKDFECDFIDKIRQKVVNYKGLDEDLGRKFVIHGNETNQLYDTGKDEIQVLGKNGSITPFSKYINSANTALLKKMYFLCFPKNIN